jgi:hypothetical protein
VGLYHFVVPICVLLDVLVLAILE